MRNQGVRAVKVQREELLFTVKANRKIHEETYNKAVQVFQDEAVAAIEKLLERARNSDCVDDVKLHVSLDRPEKHLEEYDQVIRMLEMSVDNIVELDQSEFAQYVMDKWSWARQFATNTTSYAAKFKG